MKNLARILALTVSVVALFLVLGCQVPQDKMDSMDLTDSSDPEVQQINQGLDDVDELNSLLEEDDVENFDELESYLE